MEISNLSIQSIINRLNKVVGEIQRAVSSNRKSFNKFDIERLKSYLKELKAVKARETAVELDAPHYDKELIPVPVFPAITISAENNTANEMIALLKVMHSELVKSESKDAVFGLNKFDSARFDALAERVEAIIAFAESEEPVDYPEAAQAEAEAKG